MEPVTAPALKPPSTRVPRLGTEAQGIQRTSCWTPSLVAKLWMMDIGVCVFSSQLCVFVIEGVSAITSLYRPSINRQGVRSPSACRSSVYRMQVSLGLVVLSPCLSGWRRHTNEETRKA